MNAAELEAENKKLREALELARPIIKARIVSLELYERTDEEARAVLEKIEELLK